MKNLTAQTPPAPRAAQQAEQLHEGVQSASILGAAAEGVDVADAAMAPLSGVTSQVNLNSLVEAFRGSERDTGLPLPLGGNVLRKDIPLPVQRDLLAIMRESIDYGLAHRDDAVRHSMPYARDMDATLAGKFIGMYVNDFTRDYRESGRAAVRRFLGDAHRAGYIDKPAEIEFVE